ncbi:hypothetical protein ACS0TY_024683 [Phlomoides rotata]
MWSSWYAIASSIRVGSLATVSKENGLSFNVFFGTLVDHVVRPVQIVVVFNLDGLMVACQLGLVTWSPGWPPSRACASLELPGRLVGYTWLDPWSATLGSPLYYFFGWSLSPPNTACGLVGLELVDQPFYMASQVSPNKNPNDHLTAQNFQEKTLGHSRMPRKLHMLYCYAKVALSEKVIRITIDKDVFGREVKIHIHFEDVDIFCRLHPISYSCITVYIWHLYNKFKHKNFGRFRFVDLYGVGHVQSTNNDQTFIELQIFKRARVLTNRLVGTPANQLCVVPCNTG